MTKRASVSNLLAAVATVACLGVAACGTSDPFMMGSGGATGAAGGSGTGGSGTGAGGAGGGGMGDLSQLLPIKTGNSWTYLVTVTGEGTTPKTQTVMEQGPVGGTGPNAGVTAFRFVTRKGLDGMDETISWQARVGTRVVRYREQAYMRMAPHGLELEEYWDPHKLRVDETPVRMVAGTTWTETDQETKLPVGGNMLTVPVEERWTVTAERQPVTVQGRSYEVMIVTKTSTTSTKTYWWARGIGKVKEIGDNQTEELMSYQVAP
jgi:hypothetical protein